ncbi:MAG: hypothetical protein ACK4U0_20600 [Mesorhizobium sp.]
MKTRMMTATAVALMLCAPAFAQTATTDTANSSTSMSSAMPQGWNDELGNAFFSDSELGTLRTEEEISTNWASLSAEQQAQVTGYCDTMDTASATGSAGSTMPSGDAASGAATTDTTAGITAGTTVDPSLPGGTTAGVSTDTTASTTQDGAAGGMDAGASVNIASMQRLCDVVGDLD